MSRGADILADLAAVRRAARSTAPESAARRSDARSSSGDVLDHLRAISLPSPPPAPPRHAPLPSSPGRGLAVRPPGQSLEHMREARRHEAALAANLPKASRPHVSAAACQALWKAVLYQGMLDCLYGPRMNGWTRDASRADFSWIDSRDFATVASLAGMDGAASRLKATLAKPGGVERLQAIFATMAGGPHFGRTA